MGRSTTVSGTNPQNGNAAAARLEGMAQTAHRTVDKVAGKANAQLEQMSGGAHRAVDSAAVAATTAADWASTFPGQAKEVRTKWVGSAAASIRARPLATVAGALVIGYLMGRLARA